MKSSYLILLFTFFIQFSYAQSYDEDRVVFSNFIERMYNNSPFEGCRIVDDYDNSYFLSVVALDKSKYNNAITMNRVSQIKSQRNAGEFFNGTQSYSEFLIKTPKCREQEYGSGKDSEVIETFEIVRTNSTGYAQQLQLLTSFDVENNNRVYVYYKKIEKK